MNAEHAQLIVLSGPDGGRTIVLDRLPLTMGRSTRCGIRLSEEFVSRQHATLSMSDDGVLLEVLSANGMEIAGKAYKRGRCVVLGTGDVLKLGVETESLFVDAGDDADAALAAFQAARMEAMEARRAKEQAARPRAARHLPASGEEEEKALGEEPAGKTPGSPSEPPGAIEPPAAQAAAQAGLEPPDALSPQQAEAMARKRRLRRIAIGLGAYVAAIVVAGVVAEVVLNHFRREKTSEPAVPVLTAQQIGAMLKDPLDQDQKGQSPNSQTAAEALEDARRRFLWRQINSPDAYWCVFNYARYRILASRAAFADAADQDNYDTALGELIDKVAPLYDSAAKAARQERWSAAIEGFEAIVGNAKTGKDKVAGLVPDQKNPLNLNVQRHLKRIKDAMEQARKQRRRTGPLG
jgi:hypothetical protein